MRFIAENLFILACWYVDFQCSSDSGFDGSVDPAVRGGRVLAAEADPTLSCFQNILDFIVL